MKRKANVKILLLASVLSLMVFIVSANVFAVSILGLHFNSGTDITAELEGIHEIDRDISANRGKIFDSGSIILAQDATAYTLHANLDETTIDGMGNKQYVYDKESTARELAPFLRLSQEEVLAYLNQDARWVEFGINGKYFNLEEKNAIDALNLPGIGFSPIQTRNYPYDALAANLIGFSRFDETQKRLVGQVGIELLFDERLTGSLGHETFMQTSDGVRLKMTNEDANIAPKAGNDIYLTINKGVQETLEAALAGYAADPNVQAVESWGAVVEIKTGKIIAIAEYPSYNLNKGDIQNYLVRGSQYTYEPGSTMKSFTVAAAIDQGVWPDDNTFDSSAFYIAYDGDRVVRSSSYSNSYISNAGGINYGYISYNRGYELSSNVMIAELLSKYLDPEIFHDYQLKLGFFKKTGIDALREEEGIDLWSEPHEKVTNGFGQGSTVTMLQLLQAYSSLFTDGTMIKPYLIDKIVDGDTQATLYEGQTTVVGKPFKESTAEKMRELMRGVVTSGTAKRFNIAEVEVMGKTGTAQMVIDGDYSRSQYIFSNVLAFPYENPQYMLYTAYQANTYVNDVDASAVYTNNVVRKVVSTYNLMESNTVNVVDMAEAKTMFNYRNKLVETALESLRNQGLEALVFGDGAVVIDQYPESQSQLLVKEKVFIKTSGSILMPDMTGWSAKEARIFASMFNLELNLSGSGYVVSQSIAPHQVLEEELMIELVLQ